MRSGVVEVVFERGDGWSIDELRLDNQGQQSP
jgi:hypothetical protein